MKKRKHKIRKKVLLADIPVREKEPEPIPEKKYKRMPYKEKKEEAVFDMPDEPWMPGIFAYIIFRAYLDRRLCVTGQKHEGLLLNKLSGLFAEWRKRAGDKNMLDWMQQALVQLSTRMLLLHTPDCEPAFEEIRLEESLEKWGWKRVRHVSLKVGKQLKKKLDW